MNFGFNSSTFGGPMGHHGGMMYGGNFVDVLFRHLMENGWGGLTLMAIINFYMYLSLDRIKDLFKFSNDKLAEYGKRNLDRYGNLTFEKTKIYSLAVIDKIKRIKRLRHKREEPTVIIPEKQINKTMVTLNSGNKTDLMALGNFLLKHKSHINLHDYSRENSDKYKTTETYILPDSIILNHDIIDLLINEVKRIQAHKFESVSTSRINLDSDIIIRIIQNIDYTLKCECDNKIEILKDVRIKIPEANLEVTADEFFAIAAKLKSPVDKYPRFEYSSGWSSNPPCFCNGHATGILFYVYYTKNFALFKNFTMSIAGKSNFDFGGKRYKISKSFGYLDLTNEDDMKKFLIELEKYCNDVMIPHFIDKKELIEKWISNNKYIFDPVSNTVPAINIFFESEKMSCTELSTYSRYFMNNLISNYYHQNIDSIGDKISVYQLHIKYNIEIRKKENPKYEKWQEKYESKEKKQEDSESRGENSKGDTKGDSKGETKENSNGETKGEPKAEIQESRLDEFNNKQHDMFNDMAGFPHHPYHRGLNYIPPKPDKFIEEEIKIAVAESVHIKSDKKPFQYLYLQKSQKELLESYLSNFKNNRDLYEKMGIPYKGGIMLSGEPGCGKTSCILASGTFLNKDIFYLDLGRIKTNHELKLCIDYVKTNSQKGGIIIFEDIDIMSDIVKCRTIGTDNTTEDTITKSIQSQHDKLSLSFLLNILDGTMSPENIIFIITTNHKEKLDPALIRPGRMDIDIKIEKCCKYQLEQIYFDLYGKNLKEETINKFKEFTFMTAEVILHLFHNIYNKNINEEELLKKFID